MSTAVQQAGRNEQIEILRALAIIYVLITHYQIVGYYFNYADHFPGLYENGDFGIGVDLFFVISGFVITRTLMQPHNTSDTSTRNSLLAFWVRRIFRLLPTAWLWLAISLVALTLQWFFHGDLVAFLKEALSVAFAFFNVMNVYSALCPPGAVYEFCADRVPTGHYWSLSLEEQFYLLFPLLFFFLNRKVFIGFLVFAIAAQLFWERPMFTFYYPFRTDAHCWGLLLGFFSHTIHFQRVQEIFRRLGRFANLLMLAPAIALPWVAGDVLDPLTIKTYGVGLVAFMGAVSVFLASLEVRPVRDNRINKLLLYVGSRSYALYVVHMIFFWLIGEARELYDPGFTEIAARHVWDWFLCLVATLATFVAAEWNYRLVEVPWRQRGRAISKRMLAGNRAVD